MSSPQQQAYEKLLYAISEQIDKIRTNQYLSDETKASIIHELASAFSTVRGYGYQGSMQIYNSVPNSGTATIVPCASDGSYTVNNQI